jgi:tetraacyldisaccharide 4'-kinase
MFCRAPTFWYKPRPTALALLLWPLGMLYATLAALHARKRAQHPYKAPVPVVAVGNLTVGGSGKTPLTQFLAQHLASAKTPVAIVSRGYGGTSTEPTRVNPAKHTAAQVGDEPLLLAQRLKGKNVTVWVGCNRPAVAKAAVKAGCKLIILDDGFQRHDIHRTINLLAINGKVGLGNGLPIPAGPLREWPSAIARATHIAVINPSPHRACPPLMAPVFNLTLTSQPEALSSLRTKPLIAFAGLAHPEAFFASLQQAGLTLRATVPFPDHHTYTEADLTRLQTLAKQHNAILVCTGKDSVKLPATFPHTIIPEVIGGPAATRLLTAIKKAL